MKKVFFYFAIGLLGLTHACSDYVENEVDSCTSIVGSPGISLKNGILVLDNSQVLAKVLAKELLVSDPAFVSQQDIMDKVIEEEQIYAKSLRGLTDDEYVKVKKHSRLYDKLLQEKFIKTQKYRDGSELYSLNLAAPHYAKVLNEEGFFAIKDTIFQVTSDKFKIWIKGDISNYKYLNNIEESDIEKDIHIFDYTNKHSLITRAIPKIQKRDQKVAYCKYNNAETARVILTYYDVVSLNLAEQCYNRDVYARYSYQEKLDGRNYVFTGAPYTLTLSFNLVGRTGALEFQTNGTGADDWYTIYFDYEFMNPGKQIQQITTTEDYYLVDFMYYDANVYDGFWDKYILIAFNGTYKLDSKTFKYNGGDAEPFAPLLPE